MITALASAIHGSDNADWWKTKGLVMALHAASYGALGYLLCGLWGLAIIPACVGWWFIFRGRRQAQPELKAMGGDTTLWDVAKAHYVIFSPLVLLSLTLFNYKTKWGQILGWEHQWATQGHVRGRKVRVDSEGRVHPDDMPFWDCRRPTEIATGLTGDIMLGGLLCLISII